MALNLINKLCENLGFAPLQKIDPNTQQVKSADATHNLAQAAIPTVLIGLFKYTRNHDNADTLQRSELTSTWENELFGTRAEHVIEQVSSYGGVTAEDAESFMGKVYQETISIVQQEVGDQKDGNSFRDVMTNQRGDILLYLPPTLQIGEDLNDNTIDDRTNKMEGPVSSFMHTIEKAFSSSDSTRDHDIHKEG